MTGSFGDRGDDGRDRLRGHAVGDPVPDMAQRLTQWLARAGRIDDGLLDPVDADEREAGLAGLL
jgi:hypothetical protein